MTNDPESLGGGGAMRDGLHCSNGDGRASDV